MTLVLSLKSHEVSFTVSSAFLGEDLSYVNGPVTITINEQGRIASISRSATGDIDLRGLAAMPPLADMHVHILDFSIAEEGWDLDMDSVVGEPYGLKYLLLSRFSEEELRNTINEFIDLCISMGIGYIFEFRELGIKGARLGKSTRIRHYVLGMPSNHDYATVVKELEAMKDHVDGFAISSPHYFSDDSLKAFFTVSRESRKYLASHVAETKEVRELGDLEKLLKYGRPSLLVHGYWLSHEDIELITNLGIPIVICPRSSRWFLSGIPPLKEFYSLGTTVCLGTDNAGWVKPDMWREMEETLFLLRAQGITDARWVLRTATTNVRYVVGEDNYLGEGCRANILLIRISRTRLEYVRNKYLGVIKRGGPEAIEGMILDGKPILCGEVSATLCDRLRNVIY